MRDAYEELQGLGAEVVAIGTGDRKYAAWFVEDYEIPYPVLVDDDATAADAARVERVGLFRLFHPDSYAGAARAWKSGHRVGVGKRTNQLGATFVVGAGGALRYEHYDRHTADHPALDEIRSALRD